MTSHRVLLVLNIQVGLIADPPQGISAARLVRENVAAVLEQARCASHPPRIIHCRSCGDPGDLDEKGTPTWELLYAPRSGEFVVDCRKTNAFMGTALGELIAPDAELVVVGLMSEYAVKSSTSRPLLWRRSSVLISFGGGGNSLQGRAAAGKHSVTDARCTRHARPHSDCRRRALHPGEEY